MKAGELYKSRDNSYFMILEIKGREAVYQMVDGYFLRKYKGTMYNRKPRCFKLSDDNKLFYKISSIIGLARVAMDPLVQELKSLPTEYRDVKEGDIVSYSSISVFKKFLKFNEDRYISNGKECVNRNSVYENMDASPIFFSYCSKRCDEYVTHCNCYPHEKCIIDVEKATLLFEQIKTIGLTAKEQIKRL